MITNFWVQVATDIRHRFEAGLKSLLCWLAALLLVPATSLQADPLTPFTAKYSAKLDLLIDIPVTLERTLQQDAKGQWTFSSSVSSLIAKQQEHSVFTTTPSGEIEPRSYRFDRSILGRKRAIEVDFQIDRQRILTYAQGEPWSQRWEPGVQDKLSYQLQLREDLLNGKSPLTYRIADGGQIKTYRFNIVGRERLTTGAGELDCIRVQLERSQDQPQTLIWMAPELDYLTVRLVRIDDQGREHILNLKEYRSLNDS